MALFDWLVAGLADIVGAVGQSLRPMQPLEFQPLQSAAVWAGDVIALLVRRLVFPFDATDSLDGRG